jgi:hypothetical protein
LAPQPPHIPSENTAVENPGFESTAVASDSAEDRIVGQEFMRDVVAVFNKIPEESDVVAAYRTRLKFVNDKSARSVGCNRLLGVSCSLMPA